MYIMRYKIDAAVVSDVGNIRIKNEDSYYIPGLQTKSKNVELRYTYHDICDDKVQWYAVCDGMGGEEYGEIASNAAIHYLSEYKGNSDSAAIHEMIREMNEYVYKTNPYCGKVCSGTTIVLACISPQGMHIVNVGDSRAYILENQFMIKLTIDHTQSEYLYNIGKLTLDEKEEHDGQHVLLRYLGSNPDGKAFLPSINMNRALQEGNRILLCTDGLYHAISEDEIKSILIESSDSKTISTNLVQQALDNGGDDNITAMVLTVLHAK